MISDLSKKLMYVGYSTVYHLHTNGTKGTARTVGTYSQWRIWRMKRYDKKRPMYIHECTGGYITVPV